MLLLVEHKSRRCQLLSAGFTAISRGHLCMGMVAQGPSLPGGQRLSSGCQPACPQQPVSFIRSLAQAAGFQQEGGGSPAQPTNPGSLLTRKLLARSPELTHRLPKALVFLRPLSPAFAQHPYGAESRGVSGRRVCYSNARHSPSAYTVPATVLGWGAAAGKKKSFPALRKLMPWWGEQRKTMNNRVVYVNRSTRRRKQGKQPRRGRKGLFS